MSSPRESEQGRSVVRTLSGWLFGKRHSGPTAPDEAGRPDPAGEADAGSALRACPQSVPTLRKATLPQWIALGESVRGAIHRRAGRPNQDALCWLPPDGAGPPLVLAVADGHGSARSFRSEHGARLAVEAAAGRVWDFVKAWGGERQLSQVKRAAADFLPRNITDAWREAVDAHLTQHPFTAEELERLKEEEGPAAPGAIDKNPALAYGSTVLVLAITEAYLLYLQQGDGDILIVSPAGEVGRPLPPDERLFANETTSLCGEEDITAFRVGFQVLGEDAPTLILASTDGYANSFREPAGFLKVGSDLLHSLRTEGLEVVRSSLEGWLTETTEGGAGDDITLGLLYRACAGPPVDADASRPSNTPETP